MPKKTTRHARPAPANTPARLNPEFDAQRRKQLRQHYAARYRAR